MLQFIATGQLRGTSWSSFPTTNPSSFLPARYQNCCISVSRSVNRGPDATRFHVPPNIVFCRARRRLRLGRISCTALSHTCTPAPCCVLVRRRLAETASHKALSRCYGNGWITNPSRKRPVLPWSPHVKVLFSEEKNWRRSPFVMLVNDLSQGKGDLLTSSVLAEQNASTTSM
jgi:hypothetical protein